MGGVYNPGGGGGGGGAAGFADWKTIGTGGDYADVQAMIDDSQYRGVLISNVTEDSDITLDANGIRLHLNDYTLTMGTNQFTASAGGDWTIEGWGPASEIDYTYSAANFLFDPTATYDGSTTLTLNSITIDNNSTITGAYVNLSTIARIRATNIRMEVSNQVAGGFNLNDEHVLDNIELVGGGTSSRVGIDVNGRCIVTNVYVSGTWSSFATQILCTNTECTIGDITMGSSGDLTLSGAISNITTALGTTDISVVSNDSSLSNVRVNGDLDLSGSDDCTFASCQFAALSSGVTSVNNKFGDTIFTGAVSVDGDGSSFVGCTFESTLTVASTADENLFESNRYVGNVTVDGNRNRVSGYLDSGATCTINSGAQYNDVDVTIDQAVTDNSGNATNSIAQIIY